MLFGYQTLAVRCLEALMDLGATVVAVVTHPDDPAEPRWFASLADAARAQGVAVLTPASPGAPGLAARLRELGPDLLVSVLYRRLLPPELLAVPRLAAVNLHPSLLPRYRGRAPVNWALLHGERRIGVSLHHMVEQADAGDIVARQVVEVEPEDTALAVVRRLEAAGVALLREAYPALAAGTAPRTPQDHGQATTFGRRRPEDGRVSWSWPAARIADAIRALTHPFPGAFVGDGPGRLHLWSGRAGAGPAGEAGPGTVVEVRAGEGITVATGAGALTLRVVQPAGGPAQRADRWAAGRGLGPGHVLGAA